MRRGLGGYIDRKVTYTNVKMAGTPTRRTTWKGGEGSVWPAGEAEEAGARREEQEVGGWSHVHSPHHQRHPHSRGGHHHLQRGSLKDRSGEEGKHKGGKRRKGGDPSKGGG